METIIISHLDVLNIELSDESEQILTDSQIEEVLIDGKETDNNYLINVVEAINKLKSDSVPIYGKRYEDGEYYLKGNLDYLRAYCYLKVTHIPCYIKKSNIQLINELYSGLYTYGDSLDIFSRAYSVLDNKGNSVVIKCKKEGKLQREYEVAKELEKLNKPYFVKAYGLRTYCGKDWIEMEMARGITIQKYIEKRQESSKEEVLSIIKYLTYMCMELHELGITHYDLYNCNIIVETLQHPSIVTFQINGEEVKLETWVLIKIIDYEFLHWEGKNFPKVQYHSKSFYFGYVDNVFDPERDIQMSLASIYYIADPYIRPVYRLLRGNFVCLDTSYPDKYFPGIEMANVIDKEYGTSYCTDLNLQLATENKYKVIESRKNKITDIYECVIKCLNFL